MAATIAVIETPPAGFPSWIERDLIITNGRDPLGLESIAAERIMPILMPGVLALSRRARYFTFHSFVLDEFARRTFGTTSKHLDRFIRRAEYEYGYAVKLCSRCGWDARGVLGDIALRQHRRDPGDTITRQLSIQTVMGGYGLFYRSPLVFLGMVLPADVEIDDLPKVPFDRLANQRARDLSEHFRSAVAHTAWYKDYLGGDAPIPKQALVEVAEAACLCRLSDAPAERAAIIDLFLGADQPDSDRELEARQRRRSFSLMLGAIAEQPAVVRDVGAWRQTLWGFAARVATSDEGSDAWRGTAGQWGAVVAREYQQAALSIIWQVICAAGNRNQPQFGFTTVELDARLSAALPKAAGALQLPEAGATLPTLDFGAYVEQEFADTTLEDLMQLGLKEPSGPSGLALLLELRRRLPEPENMPEDWKRIGGIDGSHQEGLLGFMGAFRRHLLGDPTVLDSLKWLAQHFIISRHQHIASTKLPRFTFRFRRELGRLRFFPDRWGGAFGAGAPRWEPLMLLSEDLGFWLTSDDGAVVTPAGRALVTELQKRQ